MPERCVAGNCSNTRQHDVQLFRFPKDRDIRRKWVAFVALNRADFTPSDTSVLCNKHFRSEDYGNLMQHRHGLHNNLRLKKDAIPSIQATKREHEGKYTMA